MTNYVSVTNFWEAFTASKHPFILRKLNKADPWGLQLSFSETWVKFNVKFKVQDGESHELSFLTINYPLIYNSFHIEITTSLFIFIDVPI